MLIISKFTETFKKPFDQIQSYLRVPHFWAENVWLFLENSGHFLVIFLVQYFLKILRVDPEMWVVVVVVVAEEGSFLGENRSICLKQQFFQTNHLFNFYVSWPLSLCKIKQASLKQIQSDEDT